jgi:hypothetical protein
MAVAGSIITLAVPATATTGTAIGIHHLMPNWSVQFGGFSSGTFSLATAKIMVSNDGNTFVQTGSDVTTDGIVAVELCTQFVRIDLSVHASGTQTATLAGHGSGFGV